MTEFGRRDGLVSRATWQRIDQRLLELDIDVVFRGDDDERGRGAYWFVFHGDPEARAKVEAAVSAALQGAGLLDPGGRVVNWCSGSYWSARRGQMRPCSRPAVRIEADGLVFVDCCRRCAPSDPDIAEALAAEKVRSGSDEFVDFDTAMAAVKRPRLVAAQPPRPVAGASKQGEGVPAPRTNAEAIIAAGGDPADFPHLTGGGSR